MTSNRLSGNDSSGVKFSWFIPIDGDGTQLNVLATADTNDITVLDLGG